MPSPFPGMDPFLEHPRVWRDFHDSFLPALREDLTRIVAPRYIVRVEETCYISGGPSDGRRTVPDVSIHPGRGGGTAVATRPRAVPFATGLVPAVEESMNYLEVIAADDGSVVTVIELLSPINKRVGDGRGQYLGKLEAFLSGGVNVVELDLLRGGRRTPWAGLPACDYCYAISRAADRPAADFWPFRLSDSLPLLPLPLRPAEDEPLIDPAATLRRVFDGAQYQHYIYERPPEPPLPPADAAWAAEILSQHNINIPEAR
jgi:hypothetical protein